jgi:hypothetical protein
VARSEAHKAIHELRVFEYFLELRHLPFTPRAVEKRSPPEPDLLCTFHDGESVAFELAELCDPEIAQPIASPDQARCRAFWTADPSSRIVRNKVRKQYRTSHPVELICYTDGRVVTPHDIIIPTVCPIFDSRNGAFRKAWLLGQTGLHVLWNAS